MEKFRAVFVGIFVWTLILILFSIMGLVPAIHDSELTQNLILYVVLIPLVSFGAAYFYKKGDKTNGFIIGAIMAFTGIILDAVITVPFVIIPQGGSYSSFFINPFFFITIIEYVFIVFFYWKIKVKMNSSSIKTT